MGFIDVFNWCHDMSLQVTERKSQSPTGQLEIGRGGLQQLLVDITFFHTAAGELASLSVVRGHSN